MSSINRKLGETEEEFCERIFKAKFIEGWTWKEVADIINNELNYNLSDDAYRKRASRTKSVKLQDTFVTSDDVISNGQLSWGDIKYNSPTYITEEALDSIEHYVELDEVIKERVKLKDERNQINSILRRITREETLKEMVHDAVSLINDKFILPCPKPDELQKLKNTSPTREAILQLSDVHYGIEIDNYWNKYNPEICKQRLAQLRDKVIINCKKNRVMTLHITNLGDLISGRIHTPLRINSRMDVVTQTQHISEILAEFIADLSHHIPEIKYYDCLDNHSRIEPIKENSLNLESLARFTAWYLKERLKEFKNVTIYDVNKYAPDIIDFETLGHKVIAVHGDKDKPNKVIQNLSLMTQEHYDLVLTSHRHHFSADEVNQTLLLSNGSVMGTDDFAEKLRLSANPSQNLIIVTEDNVMDTFYRIVLN